MGNQEERYFVGDDVEFYDSRTGREMLFRGGWLYFKHVDGGWVSQREATEDDIHRLSVAKSGGSIQRS